MVLITGATGLVGSYIARYLVQAGEKVRALKRPISDLSLLGPVANQIEWVDGDITDIVSLQEAMKGVDQVYHAAALISFSRADQTKMLKVNGEGTANVVNVALDAGVKKLLYVSSVVSLGKGKAGVVLDESEENIDADYETTYSLSKCLGEMEVWRGMMEGLDAVIVNPSLIIGGGYWDSYGPALFKWIARKVPFCAPGRTGFVDIRDVAKLSIQLMNSPIKNERFILNGENLSFEEVSAMIAKSMNLKSTFFKPAKAIFMVIAQLETWLASINKRKAMISPQYVVFIYNSYRYSNDKVRERLGYEFIPFEQTVADTTKLYQECLKEGKKYGLLAL